MRPSGEPDALPHPARRRGALVGRYVVLEEIGAGGMGVVYAAYDPSLDRRIALKLVRVGEKASHRERMLSEARALARLDHPNVVPVHDVGIADDQPFLAMEFVEGQTLHRWRASAKPDWRRILEVFIAAGNGLAAAHSVGLVHRDFKPDNVIISADGRVRVLDFGLAVLDVTTSSDSERKSEAASTTMAGTPAYMAPEQFASRMVDARSDQFAFCVTLWEALYGYRPFRGDDPVSLATAVLDGKVVELAEPRGVPAAVESVLRRGLSRDPDHRYPSMHELIAALSRIGQRRSPWLMPAAITAGVTAVVAVAIVFVTTPDDEGPCPDASERLAGIWDDDARAAVEAAVRQHEGVLGPETWTSLEPLLDAYAQGWLAQRHDACLATHERREQSEAVWALRIACLDRHLQSLHAVVELFAEGDLMVVTNAVEAAESLPSLDQCEDGQRLQQQTPPPGPEIAARVDEVEATVSRSAAMRMATDFDRAIALGEEAVERAEELGYPPTLARAHNELGRAVSNIGRSAVARDHYVDAFFIARAGQAELTAAEVAIDLVACSSSKLYDLREAAQWARHAELSLRAVGYPPVLHLRYLRELADLQRNQGNPREAVETQRDALERWKRLQGGDTVEFALAQAAYARSLAELGQFDESLAVFDLSLASIRERLGPTHPRFADTLQSKALAHMHHGDRELARAGLEEALQLYRDVYGEEHPSTASTVSSLAGMYPEGDETGTRMFEEALARQKRILPEGHPDIAITQINLGSSLVRSRPEESIAMLREGLEALLNIHGPRHPTVGRAHHILGVSYFKVGRLEDAREQMSIAVGIDRERVDRSHPVFAASVSNLALLDMTLGRYADAIPLLVEALQLQAERDDRELSREVALTAALVRAYLATSKLDEAEAALRKGEGFAEQTGNEALQLTLEAERAALLWARGEKQRAYELALRVRAQLDPTKVHPNDDTIVVLDDHLARWRKELPGK